MTYLMLYDLQSLTVLGPGSPNRPSHRIAAGHTEQRRNFVVTQSGVIPAQRNRAPPCQIVANAALLEPLKIGLKVLTHPLKDLLSSDS
jgi:hypothetical protein